MASTVHTDDASPRWWQRWDEHSWWPWWVARWRAVIVCVGAIGGAAILVTWPLGSQDAKNVQGLTGKTLSDLDGSPAPGRVDYYTNLDFLLIGLVTIGLVSLMSLRSDNTLPAQLGVLRKWKTWRPLRTMPISVRWKLLGGVSTIVYLLSDVFETGLLRHILRTDIDTAEDGTSVLAPSDTDVLVWFNDEVHVMAWLYNIKWLSLAVAVLVAVLLLGRRTPTRGIEERDASARLPMPSLSRSSPSMSMPITDTRPM